MLLSIASFQDRPYRILNQQESQDLPHFLEREERKILISILGFELWEEVEEASGSSNPSEEIEVLIKGGDYTHNGRKYKYDGLRDLLKPAVLSRWLDQGTYKFTAAGFVQATPQENFEVIDNEPFIVQYWNEYVSKVGNAYARSRPEGGTMYGFMKTNEADYPTWKFAPPKFKNRFGL